MEEKTKFFVVDFVFEKYKETNPYTYIRTVRVKGRKNAKDQINDADRRENAKYCDRVIRSRISKKVY